MKSSHRPITLIILDGFGYSEDSEYNAIACAHTPTWDYLWEHAPHTLIEGSGQVVGLPPGQMGNSEVGHLNMGAGRTVYQDFTRINQALEDGAFFENTVLNQALSDTLASGATLHILGLLSPGGVHSHENHFHGLINLAQRKGVETIMIHGFLDGRDTPPRSATDSILALEALCEHYEGAKMASLSGRYYAMDRDNRWDRTQLAYDLLTSGKTEFTAPTPMDALLMAYERNEGDEFVKPTLIETNTNSQIKDGDVVVFMNFRADRARQLTRALTDENFDGFNRKSFPKISNFTTLTKYADDLKTNVAFPPQPLTNVFSEVISQLGLKQLHIAETEKYAHVTFFFNGGQEAPFPGEDRILVPSPKVPTYDLQPEMSAQEVTTKLINAIESKKYDTIICNFANPDMVGHTGNFPATVKAIETIDECLKQIIEALQKAGGECIITADHGNAEKMLDTQTKQPHTAHTSEPVPFVYVGREATICNDNATLCHIAPTLLYLMGIEPPKEMDVDSVLKITGNQIG